MLGIHRPGALVMAIIFVWAAVFIGKMLFTVTPLKHIPGGEQFGAIL